MELEVVELVDDLLARLAGEELGVLDDRCVDLLEAEGRGDLPEHAEQPAPDAHRLGVEVARTAGRLQRDLAHGSHVTTDAPSHQAAAVPPGAC